MLLFRSQLFFFINISSKIEDYDIFGSQKGEEKKNIEHIDQHTF